MLEYRCDEQRTIQMYDAGVLLDKQGRSYVDNLGHLHLRGKDRSLQRERLFKATKGICASCGRYRDERHGDMAHRGKTPKTRCECYDNMLNTGELCRGIDWLCTTDPRKGGNFQSCHAKRDRRDLRRS